MEDSKISKKKLILALLPAIFLIIVGVVYFMILPLIKPPHDDTHLHAAFVVYKNGATQDFSSAKYMHQGTCGDPNADEQMEKAHLHDEVGDVVHVHKKNAIWRDLFKNIEYKTGDQVRGFVNGKEIKNILDTKIEKYQRVVFFIGKNNEIEKNKNSAPNKEYIKGVESYYESCGV